MMKEVRTNMAVKRNTQMILHKGRLIPLNFKKMVAKELKRFFSGHIAPH